VTLLIDTHILLWWLADDPALPSEARLAIADEDNVVFVSSATAREIAIKKSAGKLKAPDSLASALALNGFETLPITVRHALAAGELPRHHDDPFDRMLVAQARIEGMTLMTHDKRLAAYGRFVRVT
jgi:PIN domain nuclease of toxin-antitoxin system